MAFYGNLGSRVITKATAISDLAEEIAGGAMDIKGDEIRSVRSIAKIYGRNFALGVSAMLFALFIGISFIPFVFGWLGIVYLVLIVVADVAVSYFAYRLYGSHTPEEGRAILRKLYLTTVFFVIAFIVSRFL